jgi:hypothetical protein
MWDWRGKGRRRWRAGGLGIKLGLQLRTKVRVDVPSRLVGVGAGLIMGGVSGETRGESVGFCEPGPVMGESLSGDTGRRPDSLHDVYPGELWYESGENRPGGERAESRDRGGTGGGVGVLWGVRPVGSCIGVAWRWDAIHSAEA